jgi:ATP-binding cassette subfamily C protein LapB
MDEHSEHQALEALRAAMHPQHTMILVAHKPVLLDIVDRIVVLTPEGVAMDGPRDLMIERLRRSAAPPRAFRPAAMEVVA